VERTGSKQVLYKKVYNLLVRQIKFIYKEKPRFYVLRPFFLPKVEKYRVQNLKLLKYQVKFLKALFNIVNYDVLSSRNEDVAYILPNKKQFTFIQISGDLYSDLRGISNTLKNEIIEREKKTFSYADAILAASGRIQDKIMAYVEDKEKVIYYPHGVEFDHFNVESIHPDIMEIKKTGRPIAGYFGSLTHAVDQRYFLKLAKNNYNVVMIGPVSADYSELKALENVYFFGKIDYSILPQYGNGFDVCVMAWKAGEWINNSNPSKTYEYIALGKPVVSVYIPEIANNLSEFVYSVKSPEEFLMKCNIAIEEDSSKQKEKRKSFAKKADWNNKYKQVVDYLKTKDVSVFDH
jgi:hypothetical protein